MEKNNGKIIAVVALIVAVIALSVGFAAFSDQLDVSGQATIEKNDTFDVNLTYTGTPTCVNGAGNSVITGSYNVGSFSNNDDTWSGISVPLDNTTNGKKVTCTATITNASGYTAYLTDLYSSGGLSCEAADSTTDPVSNLAAVCGTNNANVKATVVIGASEAATDSIVVQGAQATLQSPTGSIAAGQSTNIYVIFEYLGDVMPDGDVKITLSSVTHKYSTVRN